MVRRQVWGALALMGLAGCGVDTEVALGEQHQGLETPTNVALNKPATSYSQYDASHPASRAVDGNTSTGWASGYASYAGQSLSVDLQGAFDVSSLQLVLSWGDSSPAAKAFEIQAWNGGCWQTVPGTAVTNNTSVNVTFTLASTVRAEKLRFVCLDTGGNCWLRELRAMAVPATAPAPALSCPAGIQTAVRHPAHAYALFLPKDYNLSRTQRWPLIIALHGIGGYTLNTNDHTQVAASPEGLANQFLNSNFRDTFQGIVVSPNYHKPGGTGSAWFQAPTIAALLQSMKEDYLVDLDRVYLTGLSGGGNFTWEFGAANPGLFSGLVPIAATNTPVNMTNLCNLATMPIWAFNGALDGSAGPDTSTAAKTKLDTQCSVAASAMQTTAIPNAGHSGATWDTAYAMPSLYTWLFNQRLSNR
ncbi:discoidin domain-containing protein [Corallococcus sp. M34]|uniref:discoidin domain-containing protein n=1 Tax=Citreicoccus inhibens TaxID=2849499 RepID=UPI001315415F|nr:discoidin domain-containing protein [Citreicoccus inhibens]MBU8898883.1 discoidin domain-containing protein [Citreicoccus inhibens]